MTPDLEINLIFSIAVILMLSILLVAITTLDTHAAVQGVGE